MRKIVVLNRMSLDGYFAGANGEMDWFIHDFAVDAAAHEMMKPDTLLMGRVTYGLFKAYWPQVKNDPNASKEALATANELDQMHKIVFSRTMDSVDWVNTKLVNSDVVGTVRALKQGAGPDITIFGSGSIVQPLANSGLIDEYLITLTPVVLGDGKALFKDMKHLDLELVEARNFNSGNVLLHYKVAGK